MQVLHADLRAGFGGKKAHHGGMQERRCVLPALLAVMEFWEISSMRAQETLTVWSRHAPGMRIGTQGLGALRQMLDDLDARAQERAAALADYEAAFYRGQAALRDLRKVALRLTRLLEGHLDEGTRLWAALEAAYGAVPRTEATILLRLRALLPVWAGLDAERAACFPPQTPVSLILGGRGLNVAALRALLAAYEDEKRAIQAQAAVLRGCREALRRQERAVDRLNKRWYRAAKASADEGTALAAALRGITTTAGGRVKVGAGGMPQRAGSALPITGSFPLKTDGVEAGDARGAEHAFAAEQALGVTPDAEATVLALGDVGVTVRGLLGADFGVAGLPEGEEESR